MMTLVSAALLLFLVMDPVGNIPVFLTTLKRIDSRRRRVVVARELVIALAVLVFFLFFGKNVLTLLRVSEPSLSIAGGIILFLIAVRMIFTIQEGVFGANPEGEPFIVPLAIPLVAGPSAMTTVILVGTHPPSGSVGGLLSLLIAWVASAAILLAASVLSRRLGDRLLLALERLMGMLLTIIAVEMFISGLRASRVL
jgi:multiple antibiotic resistance protein